MAGGTQAVWRGSEKTASSVKEEIAKRWGKQEAEKYDPRTNCFTYRTWQARGYQVKKGEKAIRSRTLVEVPDPDAQYAKKAVTAKYPKPVYLFYYKQVEQKKALSQQ